MEPNQASTLQKILEVQPFSQTTKTTPEQVDRYPHIEVTEHEVFEAVQQLKHRKDYALKMSRLSQSFSNWTPQEYYSKAVERMAAIIQAKSPNDISIQEGRNHELLAFFSLYFANDQEGLTQFCTECKGFFITPVSKLSTTKGIMLMGNTGRGKTVLFKSFSQNPRRSYCVTEAKYIRDEFKNKESGSKSGIEVVRHFSSDFESIGRSMYNQNQYDLCVDDLGLEEPLNLYGEKTEPVYEVLMSRLNTGRITHISTNMDIEEIKTRYGSRLESRLFEQMNILYFPKETPDYRKL